MHSEIAFLKAEIQNYVESWKSCAGNYKEIPQR